MMLERSGAVQAFGLTVTSSAPVELTAAGGVLHGYVALKDTRPRVTLGGPLAQRLVAINIGGEELPLNAANGVITLPLPAGEVKFTLTTR
ncbi:MAG: hypothetical protein BWY76_01102 [bacterium ADurb.Bin429]|nr:MAG: hypothetical protein BWY76_01102 [bacterium ADurb.Bin429]